MKDQQVWFVGWRGEELQPSQQYQQYAIQAGGFYSGIFGKFARKYAPSLLMALG